MVNRRGKRRQRRRTVPVAIEPVATRVVQSLALDWNTEASTGTISFNLPTTLNGLAWRCTSVQFTIASVQPTPFVIRLYGGVNSGVSQSASEITARSRTLLSSTTPTQINFRNSRYVQHCNTDSSVFVAQVVLGGSPATTTVCGVVRMSIIGAFD